MDSLAEPQWPPGLAVMKTIDDLLRCGICFEYFNIAMMIPQCSHNYCSLCIRKFLSYKTQCPTCCVAVTEPDLKNNRVLDELVKSVNFARNHLLQFALESPPTSPVSTSSKNLAVKVHIPVGSRHSLKPGSKLMDNFLIREFGSSTSELIKENESKFSRQKEANAPAENKKTTPGEKTGPETPSTSTSKQVTKVDCPVCGVSISENHINKHLDSCLSREEKKESLRSSVCKRKPLAKTVYNLLSDRDLKKKLKQHGLSTQGNKQQLIKRHQEFVHMYNAQCDALHPKSAAEIAKEIENMEKTRMRLEASKLNENIMVFTKDQTEKEIDEIHSTYRQGDNKAKFLDMTSVTNHFPQSALDCPGKLGPDISDDSSSCADIQEAAPSPPESDSCNSSSSDIIRDLLEEEEAWEASHRSHLPDTEISPRETCRKRAAENAEIEPRNKHNRN
ncbi:E3 ubiquitin-protein ligase RAD18 isoform X2 [Elephas maximus indicus]|uniref:E3 ubiquitin-protein ligase RAD18 isoform X2 n=1 Tax=Elephas maximus indicus TaxID=99487 RepID=UPI002116C731|nr:E3 ubiquitin-protein ligase RAD18 isoform X2 [Elephas maximus indicus]